MWSSDEVSELEKVAEANDGHCDRCRRPIKIYKYKVNAQMVRIMKLMAEHVLASGEQHVNLNDLGMAYSTISQRTKLRLHGLIAKVKNAEGAHVPSTWVITHKGWHFLDNKEVPAKVVVFDNQVLGHEEGTVTISEIMREPFKPYVAPETVPLSTPEAATYHDVRKPKKHMVITAMYKGKNVSDHAYKYREVYELRIDRLQIGQPVKIVLPHERVYNDLAAFQTYWRVM